MKLKYDKLLSSFAFKFNLRRYIVDADEWLVTVAVLSTGKKVVARTKIGFSLTDEGYFRDGRALHLFPFPVSIPCSALLAPFDCSRSHT